MKYKSKIDWLWWVIILAMTTQCIFLNINGVNWGVTITLFIVLGFLVYLMKTTIYTIEENTLIVKAGFLINQNIDIKTIKSVKETRNPLSAPALSLDRLMITSTRTSVLISPKLKQEFIKHLQSINPDIEFVASK